MTTAYVDPTAGFSAFALQARTDSAAVAVDDVNGEDLRALLSFITEGVVNPVDGFLVQPDLNMDILVGSGTVYADTVVVEGTEAGQGKYLLRLGDDQTGISIDAADLSNPRIDEVYVVVLDDQYDSSGLVLGRLAVTKGTPAASPTPPGPDGSWTAYLLLASIAVGAGVTEITAPDITDERTFALLQTAGGGGTPTGIVNDYAGSVAPDGYLLCDGSAVSRTTYSQLFAAIGTLWGAGDGSTTFNIPDLRRRVRISSGSGLNLADTGGAFDHDHTTPTHTHNAGTLAVPDHAAHGHTKGTLAVPDHAAHTHAGPPHTHTGSVSGSTSSVGGVVEYVGSAAPTEIIYERPTHSHSFSGSFTTSSSSGTTGSGGPTSHGTITGETATEVLSHGTITGATAAGGGATTGTNNQLYAVLHALIKT